jgi:hypothetical protein
MNTINAVLGLVIFIACLYLGFPVRKQQIRPKIPVIVMLCFVAMGSLLYCLSSILKSVNGVGFRDFAVVTVVNGREVRRIPQSSTFAVWVIHAAAECVGTCVWFLLPLAWIGVSDLSDS